MAMHDQNPDTVRASSSDTSRYPGFHSLGNVNEASGNAMPQAPAEGGATQTAPTPTPGYTAAMGTQLKNHPAAGGHGVTGFLTGQGTAFGPLGLAGSLFRKNNSPLQDIRQGLELGKPISDQSWAMAGYGPGGAYLPAGTTPAWQQNVGLRAISAINPAARQAYMQPLPQPPAAPAPAVTPQVSPAAAPAPAPAAAQPAPTMRTFGSRYANPNVIRFMRGTAA